MRIPHVARLVTVAAILFGGLRDADALDHRLVGAKIELKRSPSGKEQLIFRSSKDSIVFPALAGGNEPSLNGLRVELFGSGASATFEVPAGLGKPGWAVKEGRYDSFRFTNSHAPSALGMIRDAYFRETKTLRVKGAGVGLPLLGGQGPVAIRITAGSDRNCALFGGATVTADVPDKFSGTGSIGVPGTDTCSAQSLGFATCGNDATEPDESCDGTDDDACPGLCSASCTCPPPVCGDGIVNGSEACDGAADAACPGECQPNCTCLGVCGDGIVNAPGEECDGADGGTIGCDGSLGVGCTAGCTCCSIGGAFCADFGCCAAGQTCIPGPHFSGTCVGP